MAKQLVVYTLANVIPSKSSYVGNTTQLNGKPVTVVAFYERVDGDNRDTNIEYLNDDFTKFVNQTPPIEMTGDIIQIAKNILTQFIDKPTYNITRYEVTGGENGLKILNIYVDLLAHSPLHTKAKTVYSYGGASTTFTPYFIETSELSKPNPTLYVYDAETAQMVPQIIDVNHTLAMQSGCGSSRYTHTNHRHYKLRYDSAKKKHYIVVNKKPVYVNPNRKK